MGRPYHGSMAELLEALIAVAGFGTALLTYLKLRLVTKQRDAAVDGIEHYTHPMTEKGARRVKRYVYSRAIKTKVESSLWRVVRRRQVVTYALLGKPARDTTAD